MSTQVFCPQCKSGDCRRSRRQGPLDSALSAIGNLPWRCRKCDVRFRVWRIPPQNRLLAHCPRCGNINVERVARNRVEGGVITDLERWLKFPAYRCDPCRTKFFSLRPFRPDLPEAPVADEAESQESQKEARKVGKKTV